MNRFIISTDSCVDLYKSVLEKNNVYCIMLKRVVGGKESAELYDSEGEFDRFYEEIKKGALPTTTQLNSFELQEYFEGILKKEPEGTSFIFRCRAGFRAPATTPGRRRTS